MANYSSVILADAPIRYYPLDDTGTTFADLGSQAQNGTANGTGYTNDTHGLIAGSTRASFLNGSTSYISLPTTGLPSGASAITLEVWANVPTPSTSGKGVFCLGSSTTNAAWRLLMQYSAPTTYWRVELPSGAHIGGASRSPITAGATYHLALTYDGTTLSLYVNGVLADHTTSAAPAIAYGAAVLGEYESGTGPWAEYLQAAAIYAKALTAQQVQAHYLAGVAAGMLGSANVAASSTVLALSGSLAGVATLANTAAAFNASAAVNGSANASAVPDFALAATASGAANPSGDVVMTNQGAVSGVASLTGAWWMDIPPASVTVSTAALASIALSSAALATITPGSLP